mmetsp:Transcript_4667/g.11505  ORF Transcript_4667/g.11505 Transcript_4667/m.11505 type:complete len:227 (-) Transcript_4667:344-1024(-)
MLHEARCRDDVSKRHGPLGDLRRTFLRVVVEFQLVLAIRPSLGFACSRHHRRTVKHRRSRVNSENKASGLVVRVPRLDFVRPRQGNCGVTFDEVRAVLVTRLQRLVVHHLERGAPVRHLVYPLNARENPLHRVVAWVAHVRSHVVPNLRDVRGRGARSLRRSWLFCRRVSARSRVFCAPRALSRRHTTPTARRRFRLHDRGWLRRWHLCWYARSFAVFRHLVVVTL